MPRYSEMAYETIVTILFALGVGAAIIAYAARPRHGAARISVPQSSAIESSYSPAEAFESAPMPQVTAVESPALETAGESEVHQASESAPVVAAEVAAAGPAEAPSIVTSTADVSAAAPITSSEAASAPARSAPKAHRTQRRRSTAPRTRARPRTPRKHSQA